jgi:hypothetical protein
VSQRFMDLGQTVGYDFAEKTLTVTVEEKTAMKMKSDGWNVHYDSELGHFVTIQLVEQ